MPELLHSAWRGHAPFAQWLVREMRPTTIVELGVDYGFSCMTFAEVGLGTVYGIDSFEGDPEAGLKDTYDDVVALQNRLGITNLELIRGYFSEVAKTWEKPIDILHIDGRHRYEDVKEDYGIWSEFVKDSGVVLMHDTCVLDEPFGVHRFFAEIDLPKTNFTHSHGLGVVSKDAELIRRIRSKQAIWLVSQPWGYQLQRAGRKIRRMVMGSPGPRY